MAAEQGSPVKRDQALAYIVERIVRTGTSPTYREIGIAIDVSRPRAQQLVDQLVQRGIIEKTTGTQRNLRVRDLAHARKTFAHTLLGEGWTVMGLAGPADITVPGGWPNGQLAMLPPFQHLPDFD